MADPSLRDLYRDLRLEQSASQEDIRRAHRQLVLLHHPDKAAGNEAADTSEFLLIQNAYATLGDPDKRREYDRNLLMAGKTQRPPPANHNPFTAPAAFRHFWDPYNEAAKPFPTHGSSDEDVRVDDASTGQNHQGKMVHEACEFCNRTNYVPSEKAYDIHRQQDDLRQDLGAEQLHVSDLCDYLPLHHQMRCDCEHDEPEMAPRATKQQCQRAERDTREEFLGREGQADVVKKHKDLFMTFERKEWETTSQGTVVQSDKRHNSGDHGINPLPAQQRRKRKRNSAL